MSADKISNFLVDVFMSSEHMYFMRMKNENVILGQGSGQHRHLGDKGFICHNLKTDLQYFISSKMPKVQKLTE